MAKRISLLATASRGTEPLLADELKTLGASRVRQARGVVRFLATIPEALSICLWSRIGMRVLLPLLEDAEARGQDGLYDAAAGVAWEEHLTAATTFAVEATLKDSEHSHSGFVALKLKDAIVDRLRDRLGRRPSVDTRDPDVRIVAHLAGARLSLSLDLVGEPLHRRGYRVRQTAAPLKETLSAAVLAAAGYAGAEPLCDPMCGSGTLLTEAAMISIGRAPGLRRTFAVERWPHLGASSKATLDDLRSDARAREHEPPAAVTITGMDRDEDAVRVARANLKAAGLDRLVALRQADATNEPAPHASSPGLIVTNPPYGDRLTAGGQKGMKTFYFKLGENLATWRGWRTAVLSGNPAFESAFHRRPSAKRALWNGPIACELLLYPARP